MQRGDMPTQTWEWNMSEMKSINFSHLLPTDLTLPSSRQSQSVLLKDFPHSTEDSSKNSTSNGSHNELATTTNRKYVYQNTYKSYLLVQYCNRQMLNCSKKFSYKYQGSVQCTLLVFLCSLQDSIESWKWRGHLRWKADQRLSNEWHLSWVRIVACASHCRFIGWACPARPSLRYTCM